MLYIIAVVYNEIKLSCWIQYDAVNINWKNDLKKQKDYPGISNVFLIMIYKCSCPYSWIIFQMLDKPLIDLKPLNLKKNYSIHPTFINMY